MPSKSPTAGTGCSLAQRYGAAAATPGDCVRPLGRRAERCRSKAVASRCRPSPTPLPCRRSRLGGARAMSAARTARRATKRWCVAESGSIRQIGRATNLDRTHRARPRSCWRLPRACPARGGANAARRSCPRKWCKSFGAARRVGRSPKRLAAWRWSPGLGWPSWSRIRLRCDPPTCFPRRTHDDHRHYGPGRTRRKGRRHRRAAPDGAVHGAAPDGTRCRGALRRGLRREGAGRAAQQPQWLSRAQLGHARRHGRAQDPTPAAGELLCGVPGAAAHGREGTGGGHPGGLRAGHLHPLGRRAGQGPRHERRLQERGQPAVRRARRARAGLPGALDRGRLAVPVDRCDVREDARGRAHRERGGDSGCRRQHGWPAPGAGHEGGSLASRALLDGVPAQPHPARAARRQARHQRQPRGHQGCRGQGVQGQLAALPRALHA